MSLLIFSDLDETLVTSEKGGIHVRPGAGRFLERLSGHGPVFILSHATMPHIRACLKLIPGAETSISGIFSRKDLEPIEAIAVEIMGNDAWINERERRTLLMATVPIAPSGVVFDDQPVGSYYYAVKSAAVGIGPRMWITVPAYLEPDPGDLGLEAAYEEFRLKFVQPEGLGSRSGFRLGAVEGWVVTRDGETLKTGFSGADEAFKWIHDNTSGSWDWAIRYEGYDVVMVRGGKVEYSAKQEQIKERQKRSPEELAEEFEQAVRQAFVDIFGGPKRPGTVERAIRSSYLEPGRKQAWTKPRPEVVLVGTEYGWFEDMFSGPDWNRWGDVAELLKARGWRGAWFDSVNPAVHIFYWMPE